MAQFTNVIICFRLFVRPTLIVLLLLFYVYRLINAVTVRNQYSYDLIMLLCYYIIIVLHNTHAERGNNKPIFRNAFLFRRVTD